MVKSRCRRSTRAYFDLERFVAADALVVHLVVGVVSIATALIFNKGEAASRSAISAVSVA